MLALACYTLISMTDAEVVKKIICGDRRTLSFFYRTWQPKLLRFIETKIDNQHDAEEILQDVLFAVLEGLRDFQGKSSLQTYLFSVCNHKIIDYYRRKKIKQTVFSKIPQLENLIAGLKSPEEELETKIYKEKIEATLQKLLPGYRKLLVLKYLDNLTVGEIAQKFTTTLKSAEARLSRARKAFVKAFATI